MANELCGFRTSQAKAVPFLNLEHEARTRIANELTLCTLPFQTPHIRYEAEYLPSLRFYAKRLLEIAAEVVELLEDDTEG